MEIAPELLQQIVDHAERDKPNECVGIVCSKDGVAYAVHELENLKASPFGFEVDVLKVHALSEGLEDLGAIYHSHTRSEPVPSQTDENFAVNWPGVEWIIVGTKSETPEVRSWLMSDGEVTEVPIG